MTWRALCAELGVNVAETGLPAAQEVYVVRVKAVLQAAPGFPP